MPIHPAFKCGQEMRPEENYEDRLEDQRRGGDGLTRSSTDLFHCLGLVALLQSSMGDQGKRDDDYGNEQALLSERLNRPLIAFT